MEPMSIVLTLVVGTGLMFVLTYKIFKKDFPKKSFLNFLSDIKNGII